jgi:menaquinone-9 beta-reductase
MDYDIVVVGGGLGGSALAKAMSERGAHVLVLERETQFHDRVRGEALWPWGVAEAKSLDIYDLLCETCAFERRWLIGLGPDRDLVTTTPQNLPILTFYHPEMQEVMLRAAVQAGADVRRGALVKSVAGGVPTNVLFEADSGREQAQARLVVGGDGRGSSMRTWGRFTVTGAPERLMLAGVLLKNVRSMRDEAIYFILNTQLGEAAFLVEQRLGRARAYVAYRADSGFRLQGAGSLPRFIEESVRCGMPADFLATAKMAGPLASFSGADNWVEHPYFNGIALIGDAAATSDPCWGQGLSLTLRDARVLRDALLANDDWDTAGHTYASEHDRYYRVIHDCEDLLTEFFYGTSAEARAHRARGLPLIEADPTRIPDHIVSGPELPFDESVKARLLGLA